MARMNFRFKREITVGDLLTSLTVLISLGGLLFSWTQDRVLKKHEQANQVRDAAAKTVAKLERWREISLSLFDLIQPDLVETSESLVNDRSHSQVISARDSLYKKLLKARLTVQRALLKEDIETAYVYLYGYHPALREQLQSALTNLRAEEEKMFDHLLSEIQGKVLEYDEPGKASQPYETAQLGNSLRKVVSEIKEIFERGSIKAVEPVENFLRTLVYKSDKELLKKETWETATKQQG